jgi:Ser/Thr protein kinase RdoA (MazF antagonist)
MYIDMEEMGIGAAILDVAMAICGMCYDADDTFDIPLVQSFLKAYTSQRKLTSTERDLLPSYLIYACLGIGAWRFENFNITHPDDIRSDSYLSMMRRINNIDADLLKSLC